jgi:hypothetical protein
MRNVVWMFTWPVRKVPWTSLEVAFQNGLRLTVDFFRESWPYCRLWFQKLTNCRQSRFQKKKLQLLELVDSRFFVDFAVDFSSDFSGKMEEFVQNGLKIFKSFRRSQQSTTWPIRDPATVYFFRESWVFKKKSNDCRLLKKNPTTVDLSSKVDFKACPWMVRNVPWMFTERCEMFPERCEMFPECFLTGAKCSLKCSPAQCEIFPECSLNGAKYSLNVPWMVRNIPWMFPERYEMSHERCEIFPECSLTGAKCSLNVPWPVRNEPWMFPEQCEMFLECSLNGAKCCLNVPWPVRNAPWMFPEQCEMFLECSLNGAKFCLNVPWTVRNVPWMFPKSLWRGGGSPRGRVGT